MKKNNISEIKTVKIARIIKTHGYKGELLLKFEIDFERIIEKELFFVKIDGMTIPFFISGKIRPHKKQSAIVKLDGIDNEQEAKKIISCPVYTEQKNISKNKTDIFDEINGFDVFDNEVFIGKAEEYLRIPSNPVLKIYSPKMQEILIPVNKYFLKEINEIEKKIFFNLPEGLIDINK